jgi:hypothetical protein
VVATILETLNWNHTTMIKKGSNPWETLSVDYCLKIGKLVLVYDLKNMLIISFLGIKLQV